MSLINIRAALETTLNGLTPSIPTVWENTKPIISIPYQLVYLRLTPDNPNYGIETRWFGKFYIRLFYPQNAGTNAITARYELIRGAFGRGTSHIKDNVMCIVTDTPEFNTEGNDGDRFIALITIKFYSNLLL
jgi:hypothetical protein